MITFEWVGFEGVFRVEGVSRMLLWLAVEHRRLHFEWILLRSGERQGKKLMEDFFKWTEVFKRQSIDSIINSGQHKSDITH